MNHIERTYGCAWCGHDTRGENVYASLTTAIEVNGPTCDACVEAARKALEMLPGKTADEPVDELRAEVMTARLPAPGDVWRNRERHHEHMLVLRVDDYISRGSGIPSLVYTPMSGGGGMLLYGTETFARDHEYVGRAVVRTADGTLMEWGT